MVMGFQGRSLPYWLLLNINPYVNNKLSILSRYIYLFRIAAATSWNRQWIIWKGMKGRIDCFISLSNNSRSFIFYQIPVMAGFSTVKYAGNWSDQSSFCFSLSLKKDGKGKEKTEPQYFEGVPYTDIKTELTLTLLMWRHPLYPHAGIVELTLSTYHLPSMSTGEQGRTAKKKKKSGELLFIIHQSPGLLCHSQLAHLP